MSSQSSQSAQPSPPSQPSPSALRTAFFALHHGLPRQGPGSDATTRRLLQLAGPRPPRPRVLDLGCGPGRSALLLAREADAQVTAIDLHQPFLDELDAAAAAAGLGHAIRTARLSMDELPYPDGSFDLLWAEGSAYSIGFDRALRRWRRLLAPGGTLVLTECEWTGEAPSAEARAFWDDHYALRTERRNADAARAAGYEVVAVHPLPDRDWFDDYYTPLGARADAADTSEPGMPEAVAATRAEIAMRRDHGTDYRYAGYVLRPSAEPGSPGTAHTAPTWTTRPERDDADDVRAVRAVNLAAFPTAQEADLVDALRADRDAWLPGLSWVAQAPDGTVAGFALLTRCQVGDTPALALAPCAVSPRYQRQGAGSAAIRAALHAAREQGEQLVVVLGHAEYYPRFGFTPASSYGIHAPFEVPDENLLALSLDPSRPAPAGLIRYPSPFGV